MPVAHLRRRGRRQSWQRRAPCVASGAPTGDGSRSGRSGRAGAKGGTGTRAVCRPQLKAGLLPGSFSLRRSFVVGRRLAVSLTLWQHLQFAANVAAKKVSALFAIVLAMSSKRTSGPVDCSRIAQKNHPLCSALQDCCCLVGENLACFWFVGLFAALRRGCDASRRRDVTVMQKKVAQGLQRLLHQAHRAEDAHAWRERKKSPTSKKDDD